MKSKKFFTIFLLSLILTNLLCVAVYAEDPIKTVFNSSEINSDTKPELKNSRVYLPIDSIAKVLDYDVSWNSAKKIIILKNDNTKLKLCIGSRIYLKNNNIAFMDFLPYISSTTNTNLVPLEFLSDAFDLDVEWDSNSSTVYITSKI